MAKRAATAHTVRASFYGLNDGFDKRTDARGKIFSKDALTCASRTLPFGTKVTLGHKGHQVTLQVTDRGPYVHGRDLDVSHRAAVVLDMVDEGVAKLNVLKVVFPGRRPSVYRV